MGEAAPIMGLASTALGAGGRIYGGMQQQKSDNYAAGILRQEAGASTAAGIQGAILDRRQALYVASSAQARAGASGVTTTSPTVQNVLQQIRDQGEYKALTSVYQGNDRANEITSRANQFAYEGRASRESGWLSGMSNMLTGTTGFYDKYKGDTSALSEYQVQSV